MKDIIVTNKKSAENTPSKGSSGGAGAAFVKENYGNIKDFYKISSCIGRGKNLCSNWLMNTIFDYNRIHLRIMPY